MLRQRSTVASLALVAVLSFSGIAGAHVTINPNKVTVDTSETFTVRVPVEKESATTKVKVELPEGFAISLVKPLAGWTATIEKNADGKTVKSITWAGGKIGIGEFQEFQFRGKTAKDPGKYAFRAIQTYENGDVVEWTGPSDAPTPASVMELIAKPTADAAAAPAQQPAAQVKPATETKPAAPAPAEKQESTSGTSNTVSYAGLLLGGAALVLALRRK